MAELDQALIDKVLQDYLDYLKIELPDRIFTREWKDRSRYKNEELTPGVFTLIYKGREQADHDDPYEGCLRLLVVARIYCGVDATGLDVEKAELQLEDELNQFTEGNHGAALQILSSHTSHQIEAPHGWVVFDCRSGPHDLHHNTLFDSGSPYEGSVMVGVVPEVGFGHENDYLEIMPDE